MDDEPRPEDCWAPGTFAMAATGAGPLTGVRLAVKDMFAIEGHVSSFGHPRWRATHAPSTYTAPALTRLLAAGAPVAGLAKLDQLAWSIVGNVGEGVAPLNSLYPDRFTCGSSSGPAAAVAAGLADVGVGTDTGGSVRAPAAACGLYGLRPTHGLVSAEGALPLAPSFDTVGLLTRDLAQLRSALEVVIDLPDAGEATGRVVIPADCLDRVGDATLAAVSAVAAALADRAGCEPARERLSTFVSVDVATLFSRIQARQVWTRHGPWLAANREALAPDVAERVRRGQALSAVPPEHEAHDERAWQAYVAGFGECLPSGTVMVMPVIPDLSPRRMASDAELQQFRIDTLRFTSPASLSGRPELVIPVRHRASGKSVGVGILGPAGRDAELLRLADGIVPADGVFAV